MKFRVEAEERSVAIKNLNGDIILGFRFWSRHHGMSMSEALTRFMEATAKSIEIKENPAELDEFTKLPDE